MIRVWIVSALVVAAAVALVLVLTADSSGDRGEQRNATKLRAPPPLTEREARTYVAVWSALKPKLDEAAEAYARSQGKVQVDVRLWLEPYLAKTHHLTLEDWDVLRERVEFVVGVMRWEQNKPDRDAKLDREIEKQKAMIAEAKGKLREQLEEGLAALELRRQAVARPIHPQSRELATRFKLDSFVPQTK